MSWTFSQLPLNTGGGGAHWQQIGKAALLFLGLGCNLFQLPSPAPAAVPPGLAMAQDLLKPHGFVKGHEKVMNLVKGEGAKNNWGGSSSYRSPYLQPAPLQAFISAAPELSSPLSLPRPS